jgi:uncharacterized protein
MPSLRLLRLPLLLLALLLVGAGQAQPVSCPPGPPTADTLNAEQLARTARDRGLLWRLEKDGRVSWLYGTVHVSRPEWLVPGPRTQEALRSSEVLALELDPTDPEVPRLFGAPPDAARSARLTAGLEERIGRLAARACLPPAALAQLRPMLQLVMLSLFEARREGLHPELAVDAVLFGMAGRLGKEVLALETAAGQLAALTPESEADERELLASGLDDLESGDGRETLGRLLQAWAAGDEERLASYPQWCKCLDTPAERRFFQRVNDDRNRPMARRIEALHAARSVFAAVGALHMTGPDALPVLLRRSGFQVRRIPF